jgi:CRISPR system Cascade subunit CasD
MPNTLFLRLEGPLQAWGERARWSVRDTAPEPTKSGVVGLLACALGLNTDDDLRQLSRQIRVGMRCDQPGTPLVDYHTIGGGYKTPQLLNAEGKPKMSSGKPHTEQTWRSYLCDASFLAAVQGEPELIARLAEAVQSPHWPIFLGRKSCPPSRPPFEGVGDYTSQEAALTAWPWRRANVERATPRVPLTGTAQVRAVVDGLPADGVRRRDEVDSRSHRTFLPRYTREVRLTITVLPEED